MKEQLEQRLLKLEAQLEAGQDSLDAIEVRRTDLRSTMLRISGAIAVLEEELPPTPDGDAEQDVLTAAAGRRLEDLRTEMEAGNKMLDDIERQLTDVRDAMLQTGGAIQVVRELLADDSVLENSTDL
jgi:chromosome segregation ATPase